MKKGKKLHKNILMIGICALLFSTHIENVHAEDTAPVSVAPSPKENTEAKLYMDEEHSTSVTIGLCLLSTTDINIRQEPSTDSPIIYTIPADTELRAHSNIQDGWIEVLCSHDYGYVGYVKAEYVRIKKGQNLDIKEADGTITEYEKDGFYFQSQNEEKIFIPHTQICEYHPSLYDEGDKIKLRYRENADEKRNMISMDLLDENGEIQEREKEATGIITYKNNKQIEITTDDNKILSFDLTTAESLPTLYEPGFPVDIYYLGDESSPKVVSMYRCG